MGERKIEIALTDGELKRLYSEGSQEWQKGFINGILVVINVFEEVLQDLRQDLQSELMDKEAESQH